jgi:hypothetical protein
MIGRVTQIGLASLVGRAITINHGLCSRRW